MQDGYKTLGDRDKAKIVYPLRWKFVLILRAGADADAAVRRVLDRQSYTLKYRKDSRDGSYSSYALSMTVVDEKHRDLTYESLAEHPDILRVL